MFIWNILDGLSSYTIWNKLILLNYVIYQLNEEGHYTDEQCEDENAEVGKTTADSLSTNTFNEDEKSSETKLENVKDINENSEKISKEIDTGRTI